ncbi:adenine-specific methyltransferase EcoRI family protein [Acidithiobacillus sp. MC6.1]|nr:adenine-specific methyltransferase EcoRI family protein [Acidithiobacillus sp. MC6.1]
MKSSNKMAAKPNQSASGNRSLGNAKKAKEDEFYTQLADIEREMRHYKKHFKGKVVYCNCDDPRVSNFFHYFSYNFEKLGLKRLIATCYKNKSRDMFSKYDSDQAVMLEYEGEKNGNFVPDPDNIYTTLLEGDGDFRSAECVDLLRQADIVVTNPPFSLFREYVAQILEHGKKFVVIGNQGAITYKEIFPLIKDNKIWLGTKSGDMAFRVPDHYEPRETRYWQDESGQKWRSFGNMCWFTNLDLAKRHENLVLYKTYKPEDYPVYDNYDAIEVSRIKDIPEGYDGAMGVPITFLDKHNQDQFEILGITKTWFGAATKDYPPQFQVGANGSRKKVSKLNDGAALNIDKQPNGKIYYDVDGEFYLQTYPRILIRRKKA